MERPVGLISRPFSQAPSIPRATWETRKVAIILLAVLLLTAIGWLYLDQAALMTTTREEIAELRGRRDHALREYRYLQGLIARSQSARLIVVRAEEMGLRPADQMRTLTVPRLARDVGREAGNSRPPASLKARQTESAGEESWLASVMSRVQDWLASITFPS